MGRTSITNNTGGVRPCVLKLFHIMAADHNKYEVSNTRAASHEACSYLVESVSALKRSAQNVKPTQLHRIYLRGLRGFGARCHFFKK
jgi:hypothetical protein